MLTPMFFELEGLVANNIYILSSLVITFSVIAMGEVTRIARLFNIPVAIWLVLSAWLLGPMPEGPAWNSTIVGVVIVLLSIPFGKRADRFGSSDRIVHWTPIS